VKWLLDTNVVSESVRRHPNQQVLSWIAAQPSDTLAISILTIAELQHGIAILANGAREQSFDAWMQTHVIPNFGERTLPLTIEILVGWLELSRVLHAKGRPRSAVDLLIAATARIHDLTVVSRNVRDFNGTGVVVYDPWANKTHAMDAP
jgi:toxin FitB